MPITLYFLSIFPSLWYSLTISLIDLPLVMRAVKILVTPIGPRHSILSESHKIWASIKSRWFLSEPEPWYLMAWMTKGILCSGKFTFLRTSSAIWASFSWELEWSKSSRCAEMSWRRQAARRTSLSGRS